MGIKSVKDGDYFLPHILFMISLCLVTHLTQNHPIFEILVHFVKRVKFHQLEIN